MTEEQVRLKADEVMKASDGFVIFSLRRDTDTLENVVYFGSLTAVEAASLIKYTALTNYSMAVKLKEGAGI